MAVRPLKTLLQLHKLEISLTSTKDDEVKNSREGADSRSTDKVNNGCYDRSGWLLILFIRGG